MRTCCCSAVAGGVRSTCDEHSEHAGVLESCSKAGSSPGVQCIACCCSADAGSCGGQPETSPAAGPDSVGSRILLRACDAINKCRAVQLHLRGLASVLGGISGATSSKRASRRSACC